MCDRIIWKFGDSQISKEISMVHTLERTTVNLPCSPFVMKIGSMYTVLPLSFVIIFSVCGEWKPYPSEYKVFFYITIYRSCKLKCLSRRWKYFYSLSVSFQLILCFHNCQTLQVNQDFSPSPNPPIFYLHLSLKEELLLLC